MENKKNILVVSLVPGTVFELKDCVYDRLMIISDKTYELKAGIRRECVAWNGERCRRYDTYEKDLAKMNVIGNLVTDKLADYIANNRKDEWNNPDIPKGVIDVIVSQK